MKVEVVKELDGWSGQACLVKRDNKYFVISSVVAPYSGFETLAFMSDENGEVKDFGEVAGGKRKSREEVIAELEEVEG